MASLVRLVLVAVTVAVVGGASAAFLFRADTHASPDVSFTEADPLGDTFGAGLAQGVQHDISSLSGFSDGTNLVLTVEFAEGIGLGTPHGITLGGMLGFVDFDTDLDPATGGTPSNIDRLCPDQPAVGIERFLILHPYDTRSETLELIDASVSPPAYIADVPTTFDVRSVTATIPLGELGGDDLLRLGATAGTYAETTDCAPGDGGMIDTTAFQTLPTATPPAPTATAEPPAPTSTTAPASLPVLGREPSRESHATSWLAASLSALALLTLAGWRLRQRR